MQNLEDERASDIENESNLSDGSDEDRMLNVSPNSDSMPELASTEEWTSGDEALWVESNSDSGMSDKNIGNVTDLCRKRRPPVVNQGIITETGPYIPVSLGFGEVDTGDEQWEEVLDEWGNPTGVERRSFKLNVQDLRTESIDDDLDEVLRVNGLSDGINNRRNVGRYENELIEEGNYNGDVDSCDDELYFEDEVNYARLAEGIMNDQLGAMGSPNDDGSSNDDEDKYVWLEDDIGNGQWVAIDGIRNGQLGVVDISPNGDGSPNDDVDQYVWVEDDIGNGQWGVIDGIRNDQPGVVYGSVSGDGLDNDDEDNYIWLEDDIGNGRWVVVNGNVEGVSSNANVLSDSWLEDDIGSGQWRVVNENVSQLGDSLSQGYVGYMLKWLVEVLLCGVVNSLLLCAMIMVYSCLVTMDLMGRGDCGIVPSGGPGTVSQLGVRVGQDSLRNEELITGDREKGGLASSEDGKADDNMTQDDGGSSLGSDSAYPRNTEK